MRIAAFVLVAVVVPMLSACGNAPRFTHVEVDGPAPYVMFDQKTGQMCWAGQETANGAKVTITTAKGKQTAMPVCGDVVKGNAREK
ncbi:MAG: hypothetical protein LAP21_23110 [Acidobacteriia bacterium]|nr:hypothetical protein [Terriglobia bacterium]